MGKIHKHIIPTPQFWVRGCYDPPSSPRRKSHDCTGRNSNNFCTSFEVLHNMALRSTHSMLHCYKYCTFPCIITHSAVPVIEIADSSCTMFYHVQPLIHYTSTSPLETRETRHSQGSEGAKGKARGMRNEGNRRHQAVEHTAVAARPRQPRTGGVPARVHSEGTAAVISQTFGTRAHRSELRGI